MYLQDVPVHRRDSIPTMNVCTRMFLVHWYRITMLYDRYLYHSPVTVVVPLPVALVIPWLAVYEEAVCTISANPEGPIKR